MAFLKNTTLLALTVGCLALVNHGLAFSITGKADDDACKDCTDGVTQLNKFLMSEAAIAGESQLIKEVICPDLDDPKGCEKGVDAWWGKMATAVFGDDNTATEICSASEIGACKARLPVYQGKWGCDECKRLVGLVGEVIASDDGTKTTVDFLKGDAFCKSSASPNATVCAQYVDALMPAALPVFGESIGLASEAMCQTVYAQCQ
ncbi:hypothetical protein TCAL_04764 [Tigriopus californicus]|uniref:Saposin B-type domain-containing protein n=1 Tax=Tigriopus californicus TaxID=6832 RepID=A0A553P491_TIGCA|nr:uncharacterized protein LOC131883825 [Tigriopus californicus]TRY72470.1 hypothetical protein TCAL_04764 [Tigriopus californicus]|eukprot:TCALIF_04764-PA protein Name:"Protein of unknown function" AED:0.00 eAED:0.00 QI:81/1/1/1/1/1/2/30/204